MKVKTIGKKGSVLLMDNKRGLFITDILSKMYEKVIKNRNEEKISEYMSDNQTGGVKERATADNFVILSEIIRRKKKMGKKCYLMFGDAVKCFDKLWLKDSLVELYKAGCDVQDIEMVYKMNDGTVIEVETPSGMTEKLNVLGKWSNKEQCWDQLCVVCRLIRSTMWEKAKKEVLEGN